MHNPSGACPSVVVRCTFLCLVAYLTGCSRPEAIHFDERSKPVNRIQWAGGLRKIPSSEPLVASYQEQDRIWVVGDHGTFAYSGDGGDAWTVSKLDLAQGRNLQSVVAVDDELWVVGDHGLLLHSSNRGSSWEVVDTHTENNLSAIRGDGTFFLAVGQNGAIVQSNDGGTSWHYHPWKPLAWSDCSQATAKNAAPHLTSVAVDGARAWISGVCGIVLYSDDSGRTWKAQQTGVNEPDALVRRKAELWVSGNFNIAYTPNRGAIWWPQQLSRSAVIFNIATLDGQLWALGSNGYLFRSADSGLNWNFVEVPSNANLINLHRTTIGLVVLGMDGSVLIGKESSLYPSPSNISLETAGDEIKLSFNLANNPDPPPSLTLSGASTSSFLVQRPFSIAATSAGGDSASNEWSFKFNPHKSLGLNKGDRMSLQINLTAGDFRQAFLLSPVTYAPWDFVARHTAGVIFCSVLIAFFLLLTILLFLWPSALLWIHARVQFYDLIDHIPGIGLAEALRWLAKITILPLFVEHPRTLDAWIRAHGDKLRAEFLTLADSIQTLPEPIEDSSRDSQVRKARVPNAPVWLRKSGTEEQLRADATSLRALLEPARALIEVVGRGGSGKSYFALDCGRLACDKDFRVAKHQVIPIFVDEETSDLIQTIRGKLFHWLADDCPDLAIIRALLRQKRLLVIIDRVSERSKATLDHVKSLHRSVHLNALLLTSREVIEIPDRYPLILVPKPFSPGTLVDFIEALLPGFCKDAGAAVRATALADRLQLEFVGGHSDHPKQRAEDRQEAITPLLVALYVQRACRTWSAMNTNEVQPIALPEVFFDYLCSLNPHGLDTANELDDSDMLRAAQVLALVSLGKDFIPRAFAEKTAMEELEKAGWDDFSITNPLERLKDNGVVITRRVGIQTMYRFAFDPIADFLGAMGLALASGSQVVKWQRLDKRLHEANAEDFRRTLMVVWVAYAGKLGWPENF